MQIRLLDHPLDSKSLRPFDSSGVYVFLSEPSAMAAKKLATREGILHALSKTCGVLYVGKAKHLNQRLQNYRRSATSSEGEWLKSTKLGENARSVLLIPTPTHLEACLLEIFLIRLLLPELNYTSTSPGRIHFVLQDRESRRLSVSTRKKSGMKIWGLVRARSQARLAFDALAEGLENFHLENSEVPLKPFYTAYGRSGGSHRVIVDVPRDREDVCRNYLRGRRQGLLNAFWNSMKIAAEAQQFHVAAQMRDRYFALRDLQQQLVRSRRILRRFRSIRIELPAQGQIPSRRLTIERYVLSNFGDSLLDSRDAVEFPFVAIFRDAIEQFKVELVDASETERLRVNFEFLRLMLWWLSKFPESCSAYPEGR